MFRGGAALLRSRSPNVVHFVILWVKPFVRANVEWSDTCVFEQRCMHLEPSLFSKFSTEFCVARDIN